jgi:hypothetical protein
MNTVPTGFSVAYDIHAPVALVWMSDGGRATVRDAFDVPSAEPGFLFCI